MSNKQDLIDVHNYLKESNADDIELIAKIENQSGFDNIEEICEACDGIMIAHGDMGVEIPFKMLPAIQKKLITKCRLLGKRVITATEMLESMISNPRPTRAEISDVANAVYDGTSAIMLSGKTAAGKYPIESLKQWLKLRKLPKIIFTITSVFIMRLLKYRCSQYKENRGACTIHYIRDVVLKEMVLEAIQKVAKYVVEYEPVFLYLFTKKNTLGRETTIRNMKA